MEHPTEEVLLRFLLRAASRQENHQVVRHLLTRCPACAAALKAMKPEPPMDPGAYDEALDRFASRLRELAGAGEGEGGLLHGFPTSGRATPRPGSG